MFREPSLELIRQDGSRSCSPFQHCDTEREKTSYYFNPVTKSEQKSRPSEIHFCASTIAGIQNVRTLHGPDNQRKRTENQQASIFLEPSSAGIDHSAVAGANRRNEQRADSRFAEKLAPCALAQNCDRRR